MEKRIGPIQKMHTQAADVVQYALPVGDARVALNPLLGKPVRFRYTGRIFCVHCGKQTKTSFSQGYCFRCMQTLAQTDMCILKPELCHHHLGTCREPEWGTAHCMIDHTVYLANSSGLKVGITRSHQMRTRWMDQGAIQALPIVKVKNRLDSGRVEIELSKVMADKTNWRLMLQGKTEILDLKAKRDELFSTWLAELPGERLDEEEYRFAYPVNTYPTKLTSLNLDKQPEVAGELQGIKGQYLILSTGVINMRKYGGYELEWESESSEPAGSPAGVESAASDQTGSSPPEAPGSKVASATPGDPGSQTSLF
ncbi:MAG: hypothetical protein JWP91_2876 [Fibrobacteres bacterium]|nr:hypothetical protein [Fibrobacterota bacterium]